MPYADPLEGFFYPTLTLMIDSYIIEPVKMFVKNHFGCINLFMQEMRDMSEKMETSNA